MGTVLNDEILMVLCNTSQFHLVSDDNNLQGHRALSMNEVVDFREIYSLQNLTGVTSEGHSG